MLQTLTRRLFSKRPISAVGRGATTHMRLTGDKLICLVLCHWTAQYYRGAAQKRSRRALASALKRRAHTGWALRIDPQGHRIQSGRTNKRRGRQGNLFNRAVAQQISAIRELKQFIWLEATIMSSRTLAAAARTYFWRSAQKKES